MKPEDMSQNEYYGEGGTYDHLDEIREREEDITREARQAEKDGRLQSQTGAAHGSGGGSLVPTATEIRDEIYKGLTVRKVMDFRERAAGVTP